MRKKLKQVVEYFTDEEGVVTGYQLHRKDKRPDLAGNELPTENMVEKLLKGKKEYTLVDGKLKKVKDE